MTKSEKSFEIPSARDGPEDNGASELGIYKPGFQFKEEALQFFRQCVGEDAYDRAMNSEVGKLHHYVAARVLLSQADWEKFVWIEEHGSLDGFPAQAP